MLRVFKKFMTSPAFGATAFAALILSTGLAAAQEPAQDTAPDLSGEAAQMPTVPDNFEALDTAGVNEFVLDGIAPGLLAAGGTLDSATPDVVITLRGGVNVSPAYFGSDEAEWGPNGAVRLDYIRFPNGFDFGSSQTVGFRRGLGLQGSANYIPERDSSDYSEIDGLEDVDTTLEAGLGVGYEQRNYRVFANARYGFVGHNGWVGELGADGISYPVEGLTVTFGPRLNLGSDHFANTYFGVSPSGSRRSGLEEYNAEGGLVSVGAVLGVRYLWNERWGIEGAARYDRLTNDAADSPITEEGSADQYSFTLGITRRISLDF
jgi:MipA family protein